MTNRFLRRSALLLPLAAIAACTDLTGGDANEVAGLSIEDASGNELVRAGATGATGTLTVTQGQQRELDIVLRASSGAALAPGASETVRVTIVNSSVASWTGGEAGTLRGLQRGGTTMRVDVLSAGAATYTSPAIPIQVN